MYNNLKLHVKCGIVIGEPVAVVIVCPPSVVTDCHKKQPNKFLFFKKRLKKKTVLGCFFFILFSLKKVKTDNFICLK